MEKRHLSARTIALLAMMIALALVFSYVESLIPINFGIPGVKLGLANLVIVAALYLMNARQTLLISVVRIILAGLLFGNLFSILYSLAGGLLSLGIMVLIKRSGRVSVVTVSVFGGIFHNIGQILVAMAVIENLNLVFYLPVLLLSGFVTGLVIGIVSRLILPRIARVLPEKSVDTEKT